MTSFMLSFVYGFILNRIMGFSLLLVLELRTIYLNFSGEIIVCIFFSCKRILRDGCLFIEIVITERTRRNDVQISIIFNIYPIMVKTRKMI